MNLILPSGTPAYLSRPDSADRGLVVIPDIIGLRPLFTDLCDSLSERTGWAVTSFEPFPGQDLPGPSDPEFFEARSEAMFQLVDSQLLGDAAAAADASNHRRFSKVVSFYGMVHVPPAWAGPGQADPLVAIQSAQAGRAMAVVGSEDGYTPPGDVQELIDAGVRVELYEGADHGFVHDPSRPAHRADDAADAWNKALEFLGS